MKTQRLGLVLRNQAMNSRESWVDMIDQMLGNLETSAEYRDLDLDWATLDISVDEVSYDEPTLTGVAAEVYHYSEIRVGITAIDPNAEEGDDDE